MEFTKETQTIFNPTVYLTQLTREESQQQKLRKNERNLYSFIYLFYKLIFSWFYKSQTIKKILKITKLSLVVFTSKEDFQ